MFTDPTELPSHDIILELPDDFGYSAQIDEIDDSSSIESDTSPPIICSIQLPDPEIPVPSDSDITPINKINAPDPLSALEFQLNELGISRSEFYQELRHQDSLPSQVQLRAHFDGGSMATTTDQLSSLWFFKYYSQTEPRQRLQVADKNQHFPIGSGYLRIPSDHESGSTFVQCLYTPTLPATIVSPYALGLQIKAMKYSTSSTFDGSENIVTYHFPQSENRSDLNFPQTLIRGLLFSAPVIQPTPDEHNALAPSELTLQQPSAPPILPVQQLTRSQQRILWHQRLGHIHPRRVSEAHKYAVGIPPIANANELEKCPICAQAKLHKAARATTTSRRATQCFQGISIDYGFIVQTSNADSTRVKRLQGLNGETCYCLIVDHYSGMLFGQYFRSKAPPIDFINQWIAQYGLSNDVPDRYVRFDLGGELGRCHDIVRIFKQAGYQIQPTAPDSSHQNGPGERPHRTIADAIRTMLAGADLPPKFWPYAFHHFLRLYNITVHNNKTQSPFEICSQQKPDLSLLRVFGCRVYALPARPRRPSKIQSNARTGIFLGFAKTMKNIIYYDITTETVKTAQHVIFDEAMQDMEHKPPNARLLQQHNDPNSPTIETEIMNLDDTFPKLDVTMSPFTKTDTIHISTLPNDLLGFDYQQCERIRRPFITTIRRPSTARKSLRAYKRKYLGAYIVSINDNLVFHPTDIDRIIEQIQSSTNLPTQISIQLAPERKADFDDTPPPLHLRYIDLQNIQNIEASIPSNPYVILQLQTDGMTPEERALPKLTRFRLKKLSNWPDWDKAFDAQLDAHYRDGAFGDPVPRPTSGPDGRPPNILRIQWSNCVKTDGRRKTRACIDGSRRAAPWLCELAQTYASCIEQHCMKLFFALAARYGMIILYGDCDNAYQNAPSPTVPCYLLIDEAYISWYRKRFNKTIDPNTHVIPALRAIQGHPEAGRLWQDLIVGILLGDELRFTTTTHERNLYRGTIDGHMVIVARQVDDFAIASTSLSAANKLIEIINSHVSTKNQGIGTLTAYGNSHRYNGLDIHQTRDYIKISCETYIKRLLQTHGWESPAPKESDRPDSVPLHPDVASKLALLDGPSEGTDEYNKLASEMKFSYRQLLGELIYAYTLVRLDIGFAVCFLARHAANPHREHYIALKNIARYLRRTTDWGIVYWRPSPIQSLPDIPFPIQQPESDLPPFPNIDPSTLVSFVDASHAACLKTRRSITGLTFCFNGAAIAYKSKVQPVVATSSTEAELYAAVMAAKQAKYFRSILTELGFPPTGPTPIYEDNEAAIAMINDSRPTSRVRHLATQHFAIQEWRQDGDIIMFHIPGIINPADQQTKALASRLHHRHIRRNMGHYGPT